MTRRLLSALLLMALLLPLGPAASAGGDKSGEFVVRVEPGTDVRQVAAATGSTVSRPLITSRDLWMLHSATDAKKAASDTEKVDGVVSAEEAIRGNNPEAGGRMGSWNDGQAEPTRDGLAEFRNQPVAQFLSLAQAHQLATGAGVRVAVLDTGIDRTSLPGLRIDGGWDLVDDDRDPTEQANGRDDDGDGAIDEAHGHGTHVAGVVSLVAPDVTILPFRVLDAEGNGEAWAAAEAITMAVEQDADIINISFGSTEKSKLVEEAIKAAARADVLVVSAAGNSGADDKRYPAAFKEVIATAAATDGAAALTGFSSRGGWIDITAPGEFILGPVVGGRYARWSGTSMASPIVAGEAALILQLDPDADEKDLFKAIKHRALKLKDGGEGIINLLEAVQHAGR